MKESKGIKYKTTKVGKQKQVDKDLVHYSASLADRLRVTTVPATFPFMSPP